MAGGLYRLPPGYTIAGGTSTATPTAAGAVALLISAARQTGIKSDAFRIRNAIISSARYVPHIPAYKQGSGVINVAGAWEVLKALDKAPDPVMITSRAPVRHNFSHTLPTPNEGVGLYENGGWAAGQAGERTITLTRTTGPGDPMTFALKWTGNDENTFSSPASVALPLGKPVSVPIGINLKSAGAHTAILTLENATVPGVSHRMLATIVAGEPLNAANGYTTTAKVEVPRPEMKSFFHEVPAGVSALRVDIEQPTREVAVAIVRPDTRTANAVRTNAGAGGRGGGPGAAGRASRSTYVVSDPMPGVWEIRLSDLADVSTFDAMQAEKDEPVPPTAATLTVSAIAVDLATTPAVGGAANGGSSRQDLSVTNRMAAFTGAIAGMTLGGARRERTTIRNAEQLQYEIDVPAGSTSLMVRASEVTDPAADLDVYVFDCTGRECRNPQTDSDPVGDEIVTIQNPAAGKWKVVIDGASVPSGSTSFAYLDVVGNPTYGAIASSDLPKERKNGEQWTAPTNTWLASALPAGRQPFTAVLLQGQLQGGVPFALNVIEFGAARAVSSSQR
jgi:hypothetical protein